MIRFAVCMAVLAATLGVATLTVCTRCFNRKPADVLFGLEVAGALAILHVIVESVLHYLSSHED